MSKVVAQPIATELSFPHSSEVMRLEYALGQLTIQVRSLKEPRSATVEFKNVLGFRVLDERDLMEYWPVCSTPNGWMFEVQSGGWLSQERERDGSCIECWNPDAKEFIVTGEDDCVSVICVDPPTVRADAP